ncbi:MAG: pseudouridine synthase [Candidatus Paceibacterota bacterium]
MEYPIRLNKYLALKNIATRRGADKLIEERKVFINGKVAVLGSQVKDGDKVEVKGQKEVPYLYYAYNKPIGVITHSPGEDEVDIKESVKKQNQKVEKKARIPEGVFPVGRLDKASHGLLILTNDGRITDKLLNPKYVHEKEYVVRTSNKLRNNFKDKMEAGVNIEGYKTKKCKVEIVNENTFRVILTEGKKHQIRRMCSALFQEVADLKRIRVMNIKLDRLPSNSSRVIKGKELEVFLEEILNQK